MRLYEKGTDLKGGVYMEKRKIFYPLFLTAWCFFVVLVVFFGFFLDGGTDWFGIEEAVSKTITPLNFKMLTMGINQWSLTGVVLAVLTIYFVFIGLIRRNQKEKEGIYVFALTLICIPLLISSSVLALYPLTNEIFDASLFFLGETFLFALIPSILIYLILLPFFLVFGRRKAEDGFEEVKVMKKEEEKVENDDEKDEDVSKDFSNFVAYAPSLEEETKKVLDDGFYLRGEDGEIHKLSSETSIYGMIEYVFKGVLKKQEYSFFYQSNGKEYEIPEKIPFDHGYTFEGKADSVFFVKEALRCYNENEKRSFVYVNPKSVLTYVGEGKEVSLYVRIFDNEFSDLDNRWLVIYAD